MHTPTLGPMGPFSIKICGLFDSIARRLVPAYLFGEAVVERSNCHSFARVGGAISAQFPPNFAYKGPKARGKWYHRTCFRPAGRFLKVCRRAFPAKRGPGMATMNTRLWRGVRRSHTPWRIFGYFLCEQKVTSVSITEPVPQGGTLPIKKVGATQNVTPTKSLSYGRRRDTKFPTKLFCLLFSPKKVGYRRTMFSEISPSA